MDRPFAPNETFQVEPVFIPDANLVAWWMLTFIKEGSLLFNPAHLHLQDAHIAALWTNVANTRRGKQIAATAEMPKPKPDSSAWLKERFNYQLRGWFGAIPDFLITVDALYWREASDLDACATSEHELLHCGQKADEFGCPKFRKDGRPVFALKPHPVEEFPEIIERYGIGGGAGESKRFIEAGKKRPLIGQAAIAGACGTCALKLA